MNEEAIRLLKHEGQIHALAHAWLLLAAQLEVQGLSEPEPLERSLLATNWQGAPFEPHAHTTMLYLIDQMAEARDRRQSRDRYQSTGLDE
ncbi:MAG: hypothetical protein Q8R10_18480 [Pseudomonas sp.]|uniref:hypothetical protein n=1 Tax=Pseudomonas sp. TaxID=306 RepID=UPI002735E222|nr:hypothetical protein [Pseudomonas sp.]MDP3848409.1 hypothetical protein [Pseudomonas sp.]